MPHHDACNAGYDAAQGNEKTRRPRRSIDAVVVPHVEAEDDLEESVPDIVPDDEIHLPAFCGRRADACGRRIGRRLRWNRHSGILRVHSLGISQLGQMLRTRKTKPALVNTSKTTNTDLFALRSADPPPSPPVKVAKPPRSKAESSHAEEHRQDLGVVLDPFSSWGVDVVAGGRAHCRRGVTEQQEQHATPCDDVETVECDEEASWCTEPLPEAFKSDCERLLPRKLRGRDIAIGILLNVSRHPDVMYGYIPG